MELLFSSYQETISAGGAFQSFFFSQPKLKSPPEYRAEISAHSIIFILSFLNGLETKISRTFLDFLHLGHEFFVISGHGT